MAMIPETKDWTWVLQRPCPECGLDTRSFAREGIPAMIGANAAGWQQAPTASADPAARPVPGKWSPVEYACHVRDLLVLCDYRLGLMLTQNDPIYPNWDQDDAAVTGRYGEQVPTEVAAQLRDAAATAVSRFARVGGDQWLRKGRRSDGARFTVETFGRNIVHEAVHHLYDVTGVRHGDSQLLVALMGVPVGRPARQDRPQGVHPHMGTADNATGWHGEIRRADAEESATYFRKVPDNQAR